MYLMSTVLFQFTYIKQFSTYFGLWCLVALILVLPGGGAPGGGKRMGGGALSPGGGAPLGG